LGASTEVTCGWEASATLGLETSVHCNINPLGGVSLPLALGAALTQVSCASSEKIFSGLIKLGNLMSFASPVNITDVVQRPGGLFSIPASIEIILGAESNVTYGNEYNFTTGYRREYLNGEFIRNFADSVEFLEANKYDFLKGMELSCELEDPTVSAPNPNLTRYIQRQNSYSDIDKEQKKADEMILLIEDKFNLTANTAGLVTNQTLFLGSQNSIQLTATQLLKLVSDSIDIYGGTSVQMEGKTMKFDATNLEINSTSTKIKGKLELGMPGFPEAVNITNYLSKLSSDLATAQAEIKQLEETTNLIKGKFNSI
ncbi:MAG: hypothetical protein NZL93_01080, partial [Chthoniobacterales bacterium]|nr:hypothetical protein [Chthoniobacterales bacterium]